MPAITTLLRVALVTYLALQTLNTFPRADVRASAAWERILVLYVLLVVGYCDPVIGALLSAVLLINLRKDPKEALVIEKLHSHPQRAPRTAPQGPPPQRRTEEDSSFRITEDMLLKTQSNAVSHRDTYPNETGAPGVNIQGVFADIVGYARGQDHQ